MSCTLTATTLHGYFDGELDAVRATEFEQHLESCGDCQAALDGMEFLRSSLRRSDLYERASPELHSSIEKKLQLSSRPARLSALFLRPRFWMPAVATLSLIISFSVASLLVSSREESERIRAELLDAHVRSLQPGHLADIESTDQHTVKPWFEGKLNFIPPVTDYADQGFPLVGGRLDVIDGREIAAVVYSHQKHLINVFVWPYGGKIGFLNSGTRQGYNWVIWRNNDMSFCAVSDAAPSSLQQLKALISR